MNKPKKPIKPKWEDFTSQYYSTQVELLVSTYDTVGELIEFLKGFHPESLIETEIFYDAAPPHFFIKSVEEREKLEELYKIAQLQYEEDKKNYEILYKEWKKEYLKRQLEELDD